jgi:hypothetical protein
MRAPGERFETSPTRFKRVALRRGAGPGDDDDDDEVPIGDPPDDDEGDDWDDEEDDDDEDDEEDAVQARCCVATSPRRSHGGTMSPDERCATRKSCACVPSVL